MYQDVVDLNAFYNSFLGQVARRQIRAALREHWSDLHGLSLLGVGFATPYLRSFGDEAGRTVALMPAAQGVIPWPPEGRSRVCLAEEAELPFPDESFDRVLLVHAVESSETLRPMLREVWRVMAGGGRLMVVAPNRRGIWAHFENNPFAHGHPFSESQLTRLLRDSLYTPLRASTALYVPPSRLRVLLRAASAWEKVGRRWGLPFPGVIVIEAAKQVYAAPPERSRAAALRRRLALALPGGRAPARPAPLTFS